MSAVPVSPTASVTIQPTCAIPTGTIVITAPTGAYEYSLDGGAFQASATFTGVAPGLHRSTERRAGEKSRACRSPQHYINAVPAVPVAPTASVTIQPTCAIPTGTIVITAPTGAYENSIAHVSTPVTATFTIAAPGLHNVTDRSTTDNTCVSSATPLTVNAVPAVPVAPTASVTVQQTCELPTRTIVITPLTRAYQHSLDGGAFHASATFTG